MVDAANASTVHTEREHTSPSSLMPPRCCSGWSKHDSPCPMLLERVRPITTPLAFYSHIFAHPRRVSKDRCVSVFSSGRDRLQKTVTLTLASPPAIAAHPHLRRSLCFHGDADTDKDMNFLPCVDWVRERSGAVGARSGRRSVFYGLSSLKTLLIWMSSVPHRY